jgi:hypothetical protein
LGGTNSTNLSKTVTQHKRSQPITVGSRTTQNGHAPSLPSYVSLELSLSLTHRAPKTPRNPINHTIQTLTELSLTQREKNTHTCKVVYRRNTAQCTRSQKKIQRRALLLSYKRNGNERGPVGLILVLRLPQPSLLDLNLYPLWSMKLTLLLSARCPSKELSLSLPSSLLQTRTQHLVLMWWRRD